MNRRGLAPVALAIAVLLAGCRSSRDSGAGDWRAIGPAGSGESMAELMTNQNVEFSFSQGWHRIELSQSRPTDATNGISLVKVNRDGEVVIDVFSTGEQLRAYPGKPFLGGYQEVAPGLRARTFGACGLQVISSDPKAQSAILERAIGEHFYRIKR